MIAITKANKETPLKPGKILSLCSYKQQGGAEPLFQLRSGLLYFFFVQDPLGRELLQQPQCREKGEIIVQFFL